MDIERWENSVFIILYVFQNIPIIVGHTASLISFFMKKIIILFSILLSLWGIIYFVFTTITLSVEIKSQKPYSSGSIMDMTISYTNYFPWNRQIHYYTTCTDPTIENLTTNSIMKYADGIFWCWQAESWVYVPSFWTLEKNIIVELVHDVNYQTWASSPSRSNILQVGTWNNELLIYWHGSKKLINIRINE